MKLIGKFLILSLFIPVAYANTQYVTDVLYISLRAEIDENSQLLRVIKSATPLEVLEEREDGYTRVRTPGGDEGWVKAKYLEQEPVAALQLQDYQERFKKLIEENESLKQKFQDAKKNSKEAEKELKRIDSQNQVLQSENENLKKISARPLELSQQNDELLAKTKLLDEENSKLRHENEQFKNNEALNWFLAGGGVLFFGMLVGLIIPSLKLRKRSEWA